MGKVFFRLAPRCELIGTKLELVAGRFKAAKSTKKCCKSIK